jgi:hypothetical protein
LYELGEMTSGVVTLAPVHPFRSIAHIPRAPDAHTGFLEQRIETTAAAVSMLTGYAVQPTTAVDYMSDLT